MPALKNARQEAFCRNIAHKQMGIGAAYAAAGFKPNKPNATRLSKKPDIIARITELHEAVAKKTGWTAAKRLETLEKISNSNERKDPRVTLGAIAEANKMQGSYPASKHEHTGKDGGPIEFDLAGLTDDDLAALEPVLAILAKAAGSAGRVAGTGEGGEGEEGG